VGTNVWLGTRIRTVSKIIGIARGEHGSVVPPSQLRIFGTRGEAGQLCACGPCAADIGDTRGTQGTRASADDDRVAGLEGDDGVDAPPSSDLVGESAHVA